MKNKRVLLVIVTLAVIISYIENNNTYKQEVAYKTEKVDLQENTYAIYKENVVYEDEVVQWGLNNSGIKPEVIMNGNSWESDYIFAKKGIDINYNDFSEYSHRKCTVAIVDTGAYWMNYTNIWVNNDEVPHDNKDNDLNG